MRRFIATITIAFLIGFSLAWGVTATAAGGAGGSADPLVAKSWADDYVERQFAPLQAQLDEIKDYLNGTRTQIVIHINSPYYTVNGESRTMDTVPVINSDWRTMVPVRFVAEALGCEVDYTTRPGGSTDKVYIKGDSTVVLTINSASYTVDGVARTMDTMPVVNSDWRTMVPVRFVAEALGCDITYETGSYGQTTTVYIRK